MIDYIRDYAIRARTSRWPRARLKLLVKAAALAVAEIERLIRWHGPVIL